MYKWSNLCLIKFLGCFDEEISVFFKFGVFTTIKYHKPNLRFLVNMFYLITDKLSGGFLYNKYTPKKCITDKKIQLFYDNVAMPPKKPWNVTSLTIFKTIKFMPFFNTFSLFHQWINNSVVYQDESVKEFFVVAVFPS